MNPKFPTDNRRSGLRRRAFLTSGVSTLAIMGLCRPALAAATYDEELLYHDRIQAMAYRLFPHPGLDAAVYADVADMVLAKMARDSGFSVRMREGLRALDAAVAGNWLLAGEGAQNAALHVLRNEIFFVEMRDLVAEALYDDARVYTFLGFEGSAIERGGYRDNGAQSVDWTEEI